MLGIWPKCIQMINNDPIVVAKVADRQIFTAQVSTSLKIE
jgi:hypothetical protein